MPKQTFFNLPAEKRRLIVDIAVEEFAEQGFQGASISKLVSRAGIAKGSFYQYFEDKHDVFMHLVELVAEKKLAHFADRQPPDAAQDLFAYLRWAFEAGVEFAAIEPRLNQAVSRVLFAEGMYQGPAFKALRERSSALFTDLIQAAIARGEIAPEVDPATAAFILETLLNSLGLFMLNSQPVSAETLAQGQLDWLHSRRARQIYDSIVYVLEHGLRRAGTAAQGA